MNKYLDSLPILKTVKIPHRKFGTWEVESEEYYQVLAEYNNYQLLRKIYSDCEDGSDKLDDCVVLKLNDSRFLHQYGTSSVQLSCTINGMGQAEFCRSVYLSWIQITLKGIEEDITLNITEKQFITTKVLVNLLDGATTTMIDEMKEIYTNAPEIIEILCKSIIFNIGCDHTLFNLDALNQSFTLHKDEEKIMWCGDFTLYKHHYVSKDKSKIYPIVTNTGYSMFTQFIAFEDIVFEDISEFEPMVDDSTGTFTPEYLAKKHEVKEISERWKFLDDLSIALAKKLNVPEFFK